MDKLSDYFRLKEFDKIEAEKKCMADLKKVINICLKNGYNFSVNPEVSCIYLSKDVFITSFSSYFKGSLINYSDGDTVPMYKLLEIIKSK